MDVFLSQLVLHGLVWGLVFGAIFCLATLLLGRINAEMLLSDYPPDVRAGYGAMNETTRRQAKLAGLLLMLALLGVILLALIQLRQVTGQLTWLNAFIPLLVMLQVWNLIDLLVLDWFILMTLRPSFMILPGTAGMAGYRDYRFHFRKFINGIVLTLLLSAFLALAALALEAVL